MRRLALLVLAAPFVFVSPAHAATGPVSLGTAALYSVLGGQTVTNTGPSTLAAGLAVFPGSAFTGFPPGSAPLVHAADTEALQAQADLTVAYLDASLRSSTGSVAGDIVGQTFTDGVYTASSSLFVSGTVTLDGQGDPNSVFIFQTGSTLITASDSRIVLINGALACNVFWQVGSSATLGTGSTFVGTIMALTSITVTTGVTVEGRALARNGSTTLDSDVFIQPDCTPPPLSTTSSEVVTIPSLPIPSIPSITLLPGVTVPVLTVPAEVTTSIVSAGGTTSIVSFPPPLSSTTECQTCATSAPTVAGAVTTTGTVDCVPPKKTHEFVYAMGGVTVGGAVCGGAVGLLRFLRRRAIGV